MPTIVIPVTYMPVRQAMCLFSDDRMTNIYFIHIHTHVRVNSKSLRLLLSVTSDSCCDWYNSTHYERKKGRHNKDLFVRRSFHEKWFEKIVSYRNINPRFCNLNSTKRSPTRVPPHFNCSINEYIITTDYGHYVSLLYHYELWICIIYSKYLYTFSIYITIINLVCIWLLFNTLFSVLIKNHFSVTPFQHYLSTILFSLFIIIYYNFQNLWLNSLLYALYDFCIVVMWLKNAAL